ncbi:MAG: hypothetical protein K2G96_00740 [Clostridia bacterium]|nr:hypothetical protein [Clostridia bacterium]
MKKLFKSLTLALTVALAAVCLGVFAAACCDKNYDGEVYAVYVVYEDGTPVNGHTDGTGFNVNDLANETYISVKWCNENGCPNPIFLGTDGKASIKVSDLEAAGFKEGDKGVPTYVEIINLKAEYGTTYHKDITGPGEVKITLTKVS